MPQSGVMEGRRRMGGGGGGMCFSLSCMVLRRGCLSPRGLGGGGGGGGDVLQSVMHGVEEGVLESEYGMVLELGAQRKGDGEKNLKYPEEPP